MYHVIDLFAGCGGLTDGFLQTGAFKTLAAVDWVEPAVKTLRKRMQERWGYSDVDTRVIHFDLQRTSELLQGFEDDLYGQHVGLDALVGGQPVDLIIGGPPCQAYSIAGRVRDEHGMKYDYRNYLFESYVNLVNHYKPKAFVFENVEGMLSAQPGDIPIVRRISEAFNEINYDISEDLRGDALFDTSFYSVPQRRKRVIIFGVQRGKASKTIIKNFYSAMKAKATKEPMSVREAFNGLPKFRPSIVEGKSTHGYTVIGSDKGVLNHVPRMHSERDMGIFKTLAADIRDGRYEYTNTEALIRLYEEHTGKKSKFHKYHVIREDRPGNTIPAHLYKDGLRHIHPDPDQCRSITVREAARIQTFDDDFEFLGSRGDQYKMVGNAVPPKFAETIAHTVLKYLNSLSETEKFSIPLEGKS